MHLCVQTGNVVDAFGFERGYAMIREAGFTAIDWNLDHAWKGADIKSGKSENYLGKCIFEKPLDEVIAHYAEEVEVIRKNGLVISQAHAPFPAYVPGHPEVLEYAIGVYKRNIEFCDYVGCKHLVVHGISLPISDRGNTPADIGALNMHLYESLIPTLLACKTTRVCLENLFTGNGRDFVEGTCSDPHQAVSYIDALNAKAGKDVFGLCLDTGHLNLLRKNLRTYIPIVGKRIIALHIHDNDQTADQHMGPYTGTINWQDFYTTLHDIGYDGDLDFETFRQTDAGKLDKNPELVSLWLRTIAGCGAYFRDKIQGK